MNEIVNMLLLAGDKFMVLLIVPAVHAQKIKKESKSLCRQEIQILFIKMNLINLVFNTIWLMANQKI